MWLDERTKFTKKDKYMGRIFSRILEAADSIKKREEQLRQKTRFIRARDTKCTEVVGGVF